MKEQMVKVETSLDIWEALVKDYKTLYNISQCLQRDGYKALPEILKGVGEDIESVLSNARYLN